MRNTECQNAFEHLKQLLVRPPILAYPQFHLPFIVATDASGCAIGAVLSQEQQGKEKVIAYWSRQLSKVLNDRKGGTGCGSGNQRVFPMHTCMGKHSLCSQTTIPLPYFVG